MMHGQNNIKKSVVQQVGFKFYTCNVDVRKMYNIKFVIRQFFLWSSWERNKQYTLH